MTAKMIDIKQKVWVPKVWAKSRIWVIETATRSWRIEFDEPVYDQVAISAWVLSTGISASSILIHYASED